MLKTHRTIILTIAVILVHFTVSSIYGFYFASMVGKEMGHIVAEGIIEAENADLSSSEQSQKEAQKIYENMNERSDMAFCPWKTASFILSLPIIPFIKPLQNSIENKYLYSPFLSKKIEIEQFTKRALFIAIIMTGVNSIVFGLLFAIAYKLFKSTMIKHNNKLHSDAPPASGC